LLSPQNKVREEIQNKSLKLSQDNQNIVLEWATGAGKTYAAVKIADDIIKKNKNARGYLICKESTHKKNWVDDIKLHKMERILKNVETVLYASLHKIIIQADFIILDECHALTDRRVAELQRIVGNNTKIIFLSATIPEDKKALISLLSRKKVEYYTITLLDAINLKLLPRPKVIVHSLKLLDNEDRPYEFTMTKGVKSKSVIKTVTFKERWKIFNSYNHIQLNVLCNQLEYYTYLTDQMNYLDAKIKETFSDFFQRMMMKNKFLNIASKRKKFIASAKTKKAKEILMSFANSRHICFTGSIEQSLELGGASSVNSKNHKKVNQELIDGFNSKMYSMLFAVNMLREGLNLTEIQKGLIIQLDSTVGSYFQMLGRMLRHEFPEVHLIKLIDTQDEKYFERAMIDFSEDFIENR
jgi:superfamily II DNA or RNA helicase